MSRTEAPSTFRIPTSLVRCTAIKEMRPYNPNELMKMAMPEKIFVMEESRSSSAYCRATFSSKMRYSKILSGKNERYVLSIF